MKQRLDIEIHSRGLARSRSAASDLIKRGKVRLNGAIAIKPSQEAGAGEDITMENATFVSRAGEKLAHALDTWNIDVKNLVVLDIGASTGGFTDCLLRAGASKVIAVDVGTGQLDQSLQDDSRVENIEKTDIRNFSLPSTVDMVVIDVSFISLELVLPKAYEFIKNDGYAIVLVKPQFEVGKEIADKHRGVISDEKEQQAVLEKIKKASKKIGFNIENQTVSPIEGEKGNREFLLLLRK